MKVEMANTHRYRLLSARRSLSLGDIFIRTLLNITYDYEAECEADGLPLAGLAGPNVDRLRRLPPELIEELHNATLSGNKRLLDRLILKVGEAEDKESAQALQQLADKYEYDTLTRLLEAVGRR